MQQIAFDHGLSVEALFAAVQLQATRSAIKAATRDVRCHACCSLDWL